MALLSLGSVNAGYSQTYVERYVQSLPKQQLTQQEIKDLLHMREEEKLARDVYLTLYNYWRLPIFRNIARSEQWHMNMVGVLLKKYGIPDPVAETGDRIGVFKDQHLQELYNKLVAEGKKSLVDALKVGATIEDLDIADLERAIKDTDNEDIKIVYLNLMKGSRNHMRAFVRLLRRFGADYKPQYISQEEFERIMSTPIERGFVTEANPWRVAYRGSTAVGTAPNTPPSQVANRPMNPNRRPFGLLTVQTLIGKIKTIEQKPGPRGRIQWWVAQIETPSGVYTVYIAPVWRFKNLNLSPGDEVELQVYQPPMWKRLGLENAYAACSVKNLKTGQPPAIKMAGLTLGSSYSKRK